MDEGKSARGRVEFSPCDVALFLRPKNGGVDGALWDRNGLDRRRCGFVGESDFPNGDPPRLRSCEPKRFSVSPNFVHIQGSKIGLRVRARTVINIVHVYAGDNVIDGDDGGRSVPRKDCNHLPIVRISDAGVVHFGVEGSSPLDGTDYTACLDVPTDNRPPVSGLLRMKEVNMRLRGEKARASGLGDISRENSRLWSRWRVAESSISTLMASHGLIAMSLLHGDHTADMISKWDVVAAVLGSHNAGTPCTTLTKGCTCDLYSPCTIDCLGVNTSAEW